MKAANKAMPATTITAVSRGGIVGFSNTGNGRPQRGRPLAYDS
jgi:hypothetical protein